MLVAETERDALAALDEDAAVELHTRIRQARNKFVGQYRRGASARVPAKGARGAARPANQRAALKAEAFEEALSRVSRRVAVLAAQSAKELRDERIAAARPATPTTAATAKAAKAAAKPAKKAAKPAARASKAPVGDRALRSPAKQKARASTQSAGARRQAKRDSR